MGVITKKCQFFLPLHFYQKPFYLKKNIVEIFEAVLRIIGKSEEPDFQGAEARAALRFQIAETDYCENQINKITTVLW